MEKFDFDESMAYFWKTSTMYNESVLMVSQDGKRPEARLLFTPLRILSVKDAHLEVEYKENEDWVFEEDRLKLTVKSKAAFLTREQLYPPEPREGWTFPRIGGGHLLFQEGHYFHDLQLNVTYCHSGKEWKGPLPAFNVQKLPKTRRILENKGNMKIVLNGDSISAGANASGLTGAPPYQPDWGSLLVRKLEKVYGARVQLINTSKGGETSEWGTANVEDLVTKYGPDLVILHFGTNDGTSRMPVERYKSNMEGIIRSVRKTNPQAEFILVAPLIPNALAALPTHPEVSFYGEQEKYLPALQELEEEGIAVLDFTNIHRELLRHKQYHDLTGNHVNHPNDFMIRWYAQALSTILIRE